MPTNTEIMQACFAAFQRGDIPAILNMCDDTSKTMQPATGNLFPTAAAAAAFARTAKASA